MVPYLKKIALTYYKHQNKTALKGCFIAFYELLPANGQTQELTRFADTTTGVQAELPTITVAPLSTLEVIMVRSCVKIT